MRLRVAQTPKPRPERAPVRPRLYLVVPCPYCGGHNARSLASASKRRRARVSGAVVGRWYECGDCRREFRTIEYAVDASTVPSAVDRLAG